MISQHAACGSAIAIAALLSIGTGARAQTGSDAAAVTAANNAFYTAISALDPVAMAKVWSREPYVTSIGPRSKIVASGPTAVQDSYSADVMATLAQLTSKPLDTQMHINGNVAWVVGKESSQGRMKDGVHSGARTSRPRYSKSRTGAGLWSLTMRIVYSSSIYRSGGLFWCIRPLFAFLTNAR